MSRWYDVTVALYDHDTGRYLETVTIRAQGNTKKTAAKFGVAALAHSRGTRLRWELIRAVHTKDID